MGLGPRCSQSITWILARNISWDQDSRSTAILTVIDHLHVFCHVTHLWRYPEWCSQVDGSLGISCTWSSCVKVLESSKWIIYFQITWWLTPSWIGGWDLYEFTVCIIDQWSCWFQYRWWIQDYKCWISQSSSCQITFTLTQGRSNRLEWHGKGLISPYRVNWDLWKAYQDFCKLVWHKGIKTSKSKRRNAWSMKC